MKGVFQKNFDFFCQSLHQNQRECKNPPNHSGNVCEKIADFQKPGTQQPEIEDPSAENKNCAIQPDLSPPGPLGPDEQSRHRREPEQQVQQRAQQGELYPHPQDAEQVVDHPHGAAQQQGLAQGPELLEKVHRHPPSRRERKPPPRRPASDS